MPGKRIDADALAEKLELPCEVLGALTLTVIGRKRLLIENHRGILLYSEVCLRLRASEGQYAVYGEKMRIRVLGRGKMAIEGNIRSMGWEE